MKDRGQPPLFMAYWLWAAVCLFAVVADAVATGPSVPLNFALCMPAALASVPAAVAGAAASTVEAAVEAGVDGACEADVAAATEAWCDAFSEDFRAQHRQDRRCSNNGPFSDGQWRICWALDAVLVEQNLPVRISLFWVKNPALFHRICAPKMPTVAPQNTSSSDTIMQQLIIACHQPPAAAPGAFALLRDPT